MADGAQDGYTKMPNWIFARMAEMTEAELKIVLAVMRQTVGWQREEARLSNTELQRAAGLSYQSTVNGIKAALEHGFITRRPDEEDGRGMHFYRLQAAQPIQNLDEPEEETHLNFRHEPIQNLDTSDTETYLNFRHNKRKREKETKDTPPPPTPSRSHPTAVQTQRQEEEAQTLPAEWVAVHDRLEELGIYNGKRQQITLRSRDALGLTPAATIAWAEREHAACEGNGALLCYRLLNERPAARARASPARHTRTNPDTGEVEEWNTQGYWVGTGVYQHEHASRR